jgi:hypothetical protein
MIIDPSSGMGAFSDELNEIGLDVETIDIDPDSTCDIHCNFLEWKPEKKGRILTVGNPPFGIETGLWKKFIDHAAAFSDVIAFIVPGAITKSPYKIIDQVYLPLNSFLFKGNSVSIGTSFVIFEIDHM